MGGYSSFPICIAASILRIKFIVYEGYFLEDPLNISRIGGVLQIKNNEIHNL